MDHTERDRILGELHQIAKDGLRHAIEGGCDMQTHMAGFKSNMMSILMRRDKETTAFENQMKAWEAATPQMTDACRVDLLCGMLEKLPAEYDECFHGVHYWAVESRWNYDKTCPEYEFYAQTTKESESAEVKRLALALMRRAWDVRMMHRCIEELIADGMDFEVDVTAK